MKLATPIILSLSAATPALALQTDPAPPSQALPTCQQFAYNPLGFTPLNTDVGRLTTLIFGTDERVIRVWYDESKSQVSTPDAKSLKDVPLRNSVPVFTDGPGVTNLVVSTLLPDDKTERTYQFFIHSRDIKPTEDDIAASYCVQFTYAAQEKQAAVAKARETWAERKARQDRETAEARMAVDISYGTHNWKYWVIGDASILPPKDGIFDNSRQTAFTYPGNLQVPNIYLAEGGPHCDASPPSKEWLQSPEHLLDTKIQNDMLIVKQTAAHLRVRLAGKVADVSNCGYDPIGINPGTGTNSPDVVLQAKSKPE